MTRIKSGITVICLLVTVQLYARADTMKLHEAKMKMLRAAVGFYSSDPRQSGNGVTCHSLDFPELRKCAGKMAKVNAKLDKWNGIPVGDEAALQSLGTIILADVTQGGERARRKELPTYPDFEKQLETLRNTRIANPAAEAEPTATGQALAEVPRSAPERLPAESAPGETIVIPSSDQQTTSKDDLHLWKDSLVINVAALGIAILAMILALLKRRRKSQRRSGSRQGMQQGFGEPEAYSSESGIAALRQQVAELDRELGKVTVRFEESAQGLAAKIQRLESQQTIVRPDGDQSNTAAAYAATKKWAKSVDSGGFGIDALAADPDDKMIYEITQTGRDSATFKVSDARDAQLFALSNPQNYLREGCTYTTQPALNSQIRTEVPGILELQGRKWRIVKQAQIAFV